MVECTIPDESTEQKEVEPHVPIDEGPSKVSDDSWVMYMDGSSNSSRSGGGLILMGLEGMIAKYALRFEFSATNNEAKYEALAMSLRIAKELGILNLRACSDSQLVVGHIQGHYEARRDNMIRYLQKIKDLASAFDKFEIQQVPRVKNLRTDLLSKLATSSPSELPKIIFFEMMNRLSIEELTIVLQIDDKPF